MSRCYEMNLSVSEHITAKSDKIIEAVRALGYDLDFEDYGPEIVFDIDSFNLNASVTEEENAREVVEAIWKANGAFCEVQVGMRDLDADVPQYSWQEDAYEEWNKKAR